MEQEKGLNHKLLVIEEEFEKKLEEETQRFDEEKEALRQQLIRQQERFKKLLDEEQHKYNEKIMEKEESTKQQLLAKEEKFNKVVADVYQRWESRAEKWVQMKEELEHKVQESQSLREHEEEKTKEELQRLSETIFQLELQVSKKQKKKMLL
ncbi:GRB10-interacting GYF protein 2-like [Takifugu flavidus]|uniref:GRB10-interacting GYF protein 2-like n=1 Tax=Takifugu flavidus TaxID=433684 RepID=UPI002544CB47|nr:GRB10-interacting GYF protein 2-like [Takifugu flavidus]